MNTPTRPASAKSRRRARTAPLVAQAALQPHFVPAVALWFAALCGLGALAASADALAALVLGLHLPAILPAAAPPLGLTAHCLVAVAFASGGAVFGAALALVLRRRLVRASAAAPVVATPVRRSAAREAGHDDGAAPAATPEPDAPRVRSRDAHPDAPPRRPLVVTQDVLPYAAPAEVAVESVAAPAPEAPVAEPVVLDLTAGSTAPADLPPFLAAAYAATYAGHDPVPQHHDDSGDETGDEAAIEPAAEAAPEPVAAPAPAPAAPLLATRAALAPQAPITEAPLASLGLVQMIERLALAIATRQALRGAVPLPQAAPDPRMPLHRFDPLTMDPVGPLLRAKPTRAEPGEAVTAPTALEPAPPVEAIEADDHDSAIDGRYSSLTAMAMRRPELVAHPLIADAAHPAEVATEHAQVADLPAEDHPVSDPVVPFPLAAARGTAAEPAVHGEGPDDADSALREALATLRRMSAQR